MNEIEKARHSLAHILASVILDEQPDAKLAIGPVIKNGFYYDLDLKKPITATDLPRLERKMKQRIAENLDLKPKNLTITQAKQEIGEANPYKLELISDLAKDGKQEVSFYALGNVFLDLCAGDHIQNTAELKKVHFKLTQVARAYWRGSEQNPQLTRIYGVAFATAQELQDYLERQNQANQNNHKRLGVKLKFFFFDQTAPGMPYLLPRGNFAIQALANFSRKLQARRGYQEIRTPILNKKDLYITSGHWSHYRAQMFATMPTSEGEQYALKAMNCPNAMVAFPHLVASYRFLPLRLADYDPIHRNEKSGTLNGLLRAREFVQDDAHIFCEAEKIGEEYEQLFELVEKFYGAFGLKYSFRLGTRPAKFMGDQAVWDKSEQTLKDILQKTDKPYKVLKGDGAFYGPKIDILAEDNLERKWQLGTLQLDFLQPKNFKLKYTNLKGKQATPVVIHRAIYGSLERFLAILIEHFAGNLPLGLVWKKAIILPVSQDFIEYGEKVKAKLSKNFPNQISLNKSQEPLGKKISQAIRNKYPYIAVVGKKEADSQRGDNEENWLISVRKINTRTTEQTSIAKFVKLLRKEGNLLNNAIKEQKRV